MRFSLIVPTRYIELYSISVLPVVAIKLIVFYVLHSFHGWWRHVNFSDLISLVRGSAVATLVLIALDALLLPGQIPANCNCQRFLCHDSADGCIEIDLASLG